MARKSKKNAVNKKKNTGEETSLFASIADETKHSVLAIIFFVIAVFLILSAWKQAGVVGTFTFGIIDTLLGIGYFILPLLLFLLGISFFKSERPEFSLLKTIGAVAFFLSGLGIIALILSQDSGGIIGYFIATPLEALFDVYATLIFLVAMLAISVLLIFNTRLSLHKPSFTWFKKTETAEEDMDVYDYTEEEPDAEEEYEEEDEEDFEEEPEEEPKEDTGKRSWFGGKKKSGSMDNVPGTPSLPNIDYAPPPLSLLSSDKGKPGVGDVKANANIIKRTLANFGITVEMDEITVGPSVTRYALKPAEGVKLARIVGLQNDLGLALAAHPLRIEAPIPGKSLVGIEVPNTARSTVGLAGLMKSKDFQESETPLLFALGKNIAGHSFYANLAKIPHMLIAGTTGSGKSVTIHAILTSLLYRNSPENLRFIMVDPKRVELTLYNKTPHLLTPVITDPKKAILSLKWAAKEMDRRYDILEAESVRDISSYHENVVNPAYEDISNMSDEERENLPERMPYIVIVIDELADIMTSYPRELESSIVRIAQMSRAVGIHLVLSTQRPSVNVITGLIKANVPGRIALQVASQVDSRTILDAGGAEKLLGAGDMLYLSGEMAQPQRLQSAHVTENEVKKVVNYLSGQYKDEELPEISFTNEQGEQSSLSDVMDNTGIDNDDEDDLYEEARDIVIHAKKASTSYLQRKLKVGYARAARLMDMLEERGIVAAAEGSKPREVLVDDDGYGGGENYDNDDHNNSSEETEGKR